MTAWVVLLRGPFFASGPIDGDESLFWMVGDAWRHGHLPYDRIWDLKPPGVFLLFAGVSAAFGNAIEGPRILAAFAVVAATLGAFAFAGRNLGGRRAALAAAALFPAYSLTMDGLAGKTELFMAPFVVWAAHLTLLAVDAEGRRRLAAAFGAGLLLGAAGTIKQTAVFECAFLFGVLAMLSRPRPDLRAAAAFVAGCAGAPLAFAAYFFAHGAFVPLLQASVLAALGRLGGDDIPLQDTPGRFLGMLQPALPIAVATGLVWVERRRLFADIDGTVSRGLKVCAAWLGATSVGVLVMHATYPAYSLPLLMPLCLVVAAGLARASRDGAPPVWRAGAALVLAAALVFPVVGFRISGAAARAASPLAAEIAAYVRNVAPGAPIYVIDYEPMVHQLAGAPTTIRYPLPMQIVCDFPAAHIDPDAEIARAMAAKPAFLVVMHGHRRMKCERPQRADLALRLGGDAYRLDRRFSDDFDAIEVWRRR